MADTKLSALAAATDAVGAFFYGIQGGVSKKFAASLLGGVTSVNGQTGTVVLSLRERLAANRIYYVRSDGSDSNTGLVDSAGGAFLTLQKAWDTICGLDLNTFTATIDAGDATYTAGISTTISPFGGIVEIVGNSSTPANVVISTTSADCFLFGGPLNCIVRIKDMELRTTTSGRGIYLNSIGVVEYSGIIFGACATSHMQAQTPGAKIKAIGPYTVNGNSTTHATASDHALVQIESTTVTITGARTFTFWYQAVRAAEILARSMTYNIGTSVTATEFSVTMNSVLETGGATAGVPGGTAGTTATGGQAA